jgi:hypothetical protein
MAVATKAWEKKAITFFENSPQKVFTSQHLGIILARNREEFGAPKRLSVARFIGFLQTSAKLRYVEIVPEPNRKEARPTNYRTHKRYIWEGASPEAVALSLRGTAGYLSHATAVFHHGLSLQLPKTVYVNREQSIKSSTGSLNQASMDLAFRNMPRVSNYIYGYGDTRIVLLSGKNTGRLEVTDLRIPSGEFVPVTKLERTLIDITVRPVYAGGVFDVLDVYRNAMSRLSINVLLATLRKMNFTYPYHQAIGFYMERAGYPAEKFSRLKTFGLEFNFYLTHKIANPQFDPNWRLYYPEGL